MVSIYGKELLTEMYSELMNKTNEEPADEEKNMTAELRVSQSMFNNPNEGSMVDINPPQKVLASSKKPGRRKTPKKSPAKRLNKTHNGSRKIRTLHSDFILSPSNRSPRSKVKLFKNLKPPPNLQPSKILEQVLKLYRNNSID